MGKDQELLEAARNGNVAVVEKILSQRAKRSGPLASLRRGPGANVQDASGYSALHHAALNGHQDIVELLLTHEASTNILDSKGSSPLHLAAWAGNIDIVRLLLCHGPSVPNVNLTTKDNETALHCAAQYGHTEVVTLLLEHSCDPTIRNSREETALDLAAQYGRLETVELLVRTHPELIQPYSRSYNSGIVFPHTPLHLASRNGHKLVVDVLLSAGMDVNIKTSGGTALHEAALCGKLDVVRTLLDAGVDLCVRDAKQNTVIDLLSQFPKHVTQDIFKTLKRFPAQQKNDESDSEMGSLPPIPVPDPNLGSPYENVRGISDRSGCGRHNLRPQPPGSGMDSSPGTSPVHHWDYYSQYRDEGVGPERGMSRSLVDSNFLSEDSYQRDVDQLSISSAASSASGPSPRERRMASSDYVPMGPGSIPSPGSNNSKVSPAPPKKPPRRNLSVSPTHLMPQNSLTSPGAYEYLYLARTGEEFAQSNRKPEALRRGKSADQYEVMKLRQSYITPIEFSDSPVLQRRKSEDSGKILHEKREPVALTMYCDNIQVRTTNPRRKLRRNPSDRDKVYENYEPMVTSNAESEDGYNRTFVSNAYITLKSSQESLLDDGGRKTKTPNGLNKMICPLSPTNYQQPPTPDHPPPSPFQAEICIHERIRPLSQEYKRRSRDIETETEEELLIYPMMIDSSGSFSSTVSLSDKSVSTDNNVEEYIGDMPFAGECTELFVYIYIFFFPLSGRNASH
ncbi:UNVERIFIED_CONTAM: hypothetical protein PYX00_005679 [Menopon gallinae]|uniref:Ankyrin repeat and sterile alpha motif domain-containing protein 1B n=1 Tax=Menopon gallinae TaxID=328185 RepID=A0AAW2HSC7_9NEOP